MKENKTLITVILFLVIRVSGIAQIVTPPPPQQQVPPVGLPIDNGILILLALGVVYGIFKIISSKKTLNA